MENSTPLGLESLPNELLGSVVAELDSKSLKSLRRTSKKLDIGTSYYFLAKYCRGKLVVNMRGNRFACVPAMLSRYQPSHRPKVGQLVFRWLEETPSKPTGDASKSLPRTPVDKPTWDTVTEAAPESTGDADEKLREQISDFLVCFPDTTEITFDLNHLRICAQLLTALSRSQSLRPKTLTFSQGCFDVGLIQACLSGHASTLMELSVKQDVVLLNGTWPDMLRIISGAPNLEKVSLNMQTITELWLAHHGVMRALRKHSRGIRDPVSRQIGTFQWEGGDFRACTTGAIRAGAQQYVDLISPLLLPIPTSQHAVLARPCRPRESRKSSN